LILITATMARCRSAMNTPRIKGHRRTSMAMKRAMAGDTQFMKKAAGVKFG
jgi:hypothetical protein